jgi:polyisoprenoid-binding protein YceI
METNMSTERWEIDSSRSGIRFAVRHLVLSKTRGRFSRWSGTAMVPDGDVTRATLDVVIDASSIDTGVVRRDQHLRSADYFDVARYPRITFTTRDVSAEPEGRLRVVGTLTIKGVTRHVTLAVVPNGGTLEPSGQRRVGFSATTTIDRRKFGFTGNPALDTGGVVIGERIDVEIEVEAVRQPALRAA